jgi:hypothetical protein
MGELHERLSLIDHQHRSESSLKAAPFAPTPFGRTKERGTRTKETGSKEALVLQPLALNL